MSENGDDGESESAEDEPFADILDRIEGADDRDAGAPADAMGTGTADGHEPGPADGQVPDPEEAFSEETFEEVDRDELWEELEEESPSDEDTEPVTEDEPSTGPTVEEAGDGETHVVPKRSFCQSCEYLTDPPEFRCTAEGSEIVAFVDTDTVRVRNCPIVAQRRADEEDGR